MGMPHFPHFFLMSRSNFNTNPSIILQTEFMRGLVQIAVEKLHYELPHLYYDDSLFSHCVDEALGFDREVRNSYGYPAVQPGVIEVLTQAQTFLKWINMEKHCE